MWKKNTIRRTREPERARVLICCLSVSDLQRTVYAQGSVSGAALVRFLIHK
jgi:hypothetical protein